MISSTNVLVDSFVPQGELNTKLLDYLHPIGSLKDKKLPSNIIKSAIFKCLWLRSFSFFPESNKTFFSDSY